MVANPTACLLLAARIPLVFPIDLLPSPRVFARVYLRGTGARPSRRQRVARACSLRDGRHLRREEVSGGGQRTHRPKDRCVARGSDAEAEESSEETLVWDETSNQRWKKFRPSDANDATRA